MTYRSFVVVVLVLPGIAQVACSDNSGSTPASAGAGGGAARAGTGGAAGAPAYAPDGGADAAASGVNPELATPGRYVTDPLTPGEYTCAGTTLGAVLDALRAARPELADITTIYNPARQVAGDGSFVYPYLKSGGGFAIALKRGAGDCPAGCTDNFYYYFETGETCVLADVGHYHARWGDGSCLDVEGMPRWSHPPPPNPALVCGADNSAQDQRGTYTFLAVGQSQACVVNPGNGNTNAVRVSVVLTVTQDPNDLSTGTVTFSGTGHPLIDGVSLDAKFSRQRFEADQQSSNLPNACPREFGIMANYDFETAQPGSLNVSEFGSDSCTACKGFTNLALTLN